MAKKSESSPSKDQQNTEENDQQKKFEERVKLFMGPFRSACTKHKAVVAIAVVIDPEEPNHPYVWGCGHDYNQAKIIAGVLRELKESLFRALET